MEKSVWVKLILFIKKSYSQNLGKSLSGFGLGIGLFHPIYFAHIPVVLIHDWLGVWLWVKTIFSAFVASLATSAGSDTWVRIKKWWKERTDDGGVRKSFRKNIRKRKR